jgi:hypothetical protein
LKLQLINEQQYELNDKQKAECAYADDEQVCLKAKKEEMLIANTTDVKGWSVSY